MSHYQGAPSRANVSARPRSSAAMLAAALCASLAALTTGAPAQSLAAAVLAARVVRQLRHEVPSRRTTTMMLMAVALQGRHVQSWHAKRSTSVDSMDRDHRMAKLSTMIDIASALQAINVRAVEGGLS